MKFHSLFRYGRRFFCPVLFGYAILGTQSMLAHISFTSHRTYFSLVQQQVSGTVADASGPLPGVAVSVKGTSRTAMSDLDGRYTIDASDGEVLIFSYIGYSVVESFVKGSILDIVLKSSVHSMQEVTVNAGYYSVKEKERTGSIARITSKDIETQPVTNILAAMQGRMAGVNITQTTGTPGGGFEVQIRGINSLRADGNRPLYIIDGMPYSSDPIGPGQNSTVLPSQPSPLNSINPDQIESIEVLKDADATAIYGSRGANGVVLVTTKKGKTGRTKVSASASTGAGTVTRFMDLMNRDQYLAMRKEAFVNDGFSAPPAEAYDINGTWDRNRNTDWQKKLFGGTASTSDIRLSLSGGSAQTQFLISGNLSRQGTVLDGNFDYAKGNVYFNLGHSTEDKRFRIDFSAGYTVQDNDQPRLDVMNEILSLAPNAPALRHADGSLNWEDSTWENPIREYEGRYGAKTYDLIANTVLSYELAEGLTLKSGFGFSSTLHDELTTSPSTRTNPAFGLTSQSSGLYVSEADRKSWIAEPQAQWKRQWGKMRLDVLAGATFQSQRSSQLAQYASGFSSNSLINNIASATTVRTSISETKVYRYQALFGRINLNIDEKYILNLTGRRDGSSRFGPGRQFANFGAIGAAWLFSEERWLKDSKAVQFGKLRASYGVTGNDQIGDYQYLDTYNSTGNNYDGTIGIQPTRLFNPDFGWETNRKLEVAAEMGFFDGRLFFTASWYNNVSGNQLTGIPLPGTTGFSSMQSNLDATVQNRGMELTLRTENIKSAAFSWTTSLNISFERNKLLEFPDLETSTYKNTYVIGQPIGIRKLYHSTGVDPQTGLYTFEDYNGDGLLTAGGDKKKTADLSPDYYGGVLNQLQYGRWNVGFLFQFVKQLNYNATANFNPPGTSNQPASAADRWQQPGDISQHQRYTAGYDNDAMEAYYKYMESDAAISDASFIRLKNVSVSYDLPDGLLPHLKCRIFAEAQNLLTITSFEGADPEFSVSGFLPPLRVISAGVQLNF